MRLIIIISMFLFLAGCHENASKMDSLEYNGPLIDLDNVQTLYSDSAIVKLKLKAPRQLEFDNGDKEFPQGLYLEYYNDSGTVISTLSADYCYYYHETDTWRVLRNVILKDLKTGQQLNTEELFWEPRKEMVHTSKFVRVETEDEILMGEDLEAKQAGITAPAQEPDPTDSANAASTPARCCGGCRVAARSSRNSHTWPSD